MDVRDRDTCDQWTTDTDTDNVMADTDNNDNTHDNIVNIIIVRAANCPDIRSST